jgi:hypothetical protein
VLACFACDPFDRVRCTSDVECPRDLPACVDGACALGEGEGEGAAGEGEGEGAVGEGEGRAGEGEGEGVVACSDDGDCAPALCGGDGCVGTAESACASNRASRDRESGGPAIFDVVAGATSPCTPDGAGVEVAFSYVDRVGDMTTSAEFGPVLYVETATSVAPFTFQSAQILSESGDGSSGTLDVVGCVDDASGVLGVWSQDVAGHLSNVACATP